MYNVKAFLSYMLTFTGVQLVVAHQLIAILLLQETKSIKREWNQYLKSKKKRYIQIIKMKNISVIKMVNWKLQKNRSCINHLKYYLRDMVTLEK